jgi:hypothetical protein
MAEQRNQNKMNIKASDEALKGAYSNAAQISHTKEEVIVDFFLMHPPVGQLASRIILSPGHAKRLANALLQNLANYEKQHGEIQPAEAPVDGEVGFSAN